MRVLFQRTGGFLILWLLFLLLGTVLVSLYGKTGFHILVNQYQPQSIDVFFVWITRLGEGWGLAAGFIFLLFYHRKSLLFYLSSWAFSVLTVQILKKGFFSEIPRPASVFSEDGPIRFVEGVSYRHWESFPSGHTADAFSVCFALALIMGNKYHSGWWFVPACIIAFSRVYLSQHFFQDILAGAFISVFCTSLCFLIWQKWKPGFLNS